MRLYWIVGKCLNTPPPLSFSKHNLSFVSSAPVHIITTLQKPPFSAGLAFSSVLIQENNGLSGKNPCVFVETLNITSSIHIFQYQDTSFCVILSFHVEFHTSMTPSNGANLPAVITLYLDELKQRGSILSVMAQKRNLSVSVSKTLHRVVWGWGGQRKETTNDWKVLLFVIMLAPAPPPFFFPFTPP